MRPPGLPAPTRLDGIELPRTTDQLRQAAKATSEASWTHPTIDTLLDLRAEHGFVADEVEQIEIGVDAVTPTVLIHDRPTEGLEAKFSMHFCAAAAVANGRVDIQTFETGLADPVIRRLLTRVRMRVDPSVGGDQPALTEAMVTVRLADGRSLERRVRGARGYPSRPPTAEELDRKFRTCAERVVSPAAASEALDFLRDLERRPRVAALTELLASSVPA